MKPFKHFGPPRARRCGDARHSNALTSNLKADGTRLRLARVVRLTTPSSTKAS